MTGASSYKAQLRANFAIIYLVWGSTFLVIRIGVQDLPPLLFAGGRALIAGLVLLLLALRQRDELPRTRRDWLLMGFFALTLLVLSSGPATYALQYLPSNEVALLNASLALWIAGLGTLGPKGQKVTFRSMAGLLLGFAGVALLVWPESEVHLDSHLGWQLLVLAGCLSWAIGTIVYRNQTLAVGPVGFNAILMLLGGVGLVVAGAASGEVPRWHWEMRGMLAMLYLALIGSALAYTAYTWLLKNARTDRVATFAYVNPAIATLLGWLVLGETLTAQQTLGMFVILGAVALVTMPTRIA
jgi:drug/metabolite transporter (DMT)-like permease